MSGTIMLCGVNHEWHTCIMCGVIYTIPKAMIDKQRLSGGFHYCCNGHSQGWNNGDTEQDKIRRERDQLRQKMAQKDDELRAKERELDAERAKAVKAKKRAAHGVCPCCNRTVSQMARHMKTKHPNFLASEIPQGATRQ